MAHRLLAGARAEHQQHQEPERLIPEQLPDGHPLLALRDQRRHGCLDEYNGIDHGDHRPDARQDPPVFDPHEAEKHGGDQDNADMAPAVKRVEQAHGGFLILRRAALHDRADEHLDQPAANCVNDDGD